MEMNILEGIITFLSNLDWGYVSSFMLISYFIAGDELLNPMKPSKLKLILLSIPRVWRVLLIGIIWGVIVYWLRDYHMLERNGKDKVEWMISSLFFTMVFYQAIIKRIQSVVGNSDKT